MATAPGEIKRSCRRIPLHCRGRPIPSETQQGRPAAPLREACASRSLPVELAGQFVRASYSEGSCRQRDSAAEELAHDKKGPKKEGPRQRRGQFDREEVNAMGDTAVHRSFTLHCKP